MTKSHPMIAVSRIRPFDNLQAVHATYLDCYPEANRISGSALALSPDDVRLRVFQGYSFAVATINPYSRTTDCLRALLPGFRVCGQLALVVWCAALVTLPFLAAVHFDSDDFRMRPSTSLRAQRPNWKQAISSPPTACAGLAKLT